MKIKLLKTFIVAVVALSLMFVPAMAKTEIYTTYGENGNVVLNIKSDEGACQYAVIVAKPSNTIDNMEEVAPWKTLPADYTGTKGTVSLQSYDLGTPADAGSYTVYVSGGNMTENEVFSFAVGASDSASALSALNGAFTAQEVAAALNSYNDSVWSVDKSKINAVRSAFAGIKDEQYPDGFADANDVEECFRKAVVLNELTSAPEGELSELYNFYSQDLGLSLIAETEQAVSTGDALTEKAFADLKKDKALNPITSNQELETILERSVALGKLNGATRETTKDVWDTYGVALGIKKADGSYVNPDFDEVDSYELIKLVERNEGRKLFTSLKEVKDTYDDAIESLMDDDDKKGSSSGGGGGGGGGVTIGSSVAVTNPEIFNETVTEVPTSNLFKDLPINHWALMQIEYAAKTGIVNGDNLGNVNPDAQITRAEFVQLIANSFVLARPATGTPKLDFLEHNDTKEAPKGMEFSDVPYESWFYNAVDMAYKAGIASGYDDGRFGATDYITRQDAAAMLLRAKDACSVVITAQKDEIKFTDADSIAEYASEAIKQMQKYGVINGYPDGTFRPTALITRAEAITLIYQIRRLSGNL